MANLAPELGTQKLPWLPYPEGQLPSLDIGVGAGSSA